MSSQDTISNDQEDSSFISQGTSSQASQSQSSQKTDSKLPDDYLSKDDILCLGQKVTCVFLREVGGLGFIDPAAGLEKVPIGAKLDLPLWMAQTLHNRKAISIELPKVYTETYREILSADASVVDLHKLGPSYFTMGKHLINCRVPESAAIAISMKETFFKRVESILNFSFNPCDDTQKEFLGYKNILDNTEKELLREGREATEDNRKWEMRTSGKLTTNRMVAKLSRKRAIPELNGDEGCGRQKRPSGS